MARLESGLAILSQLGVMHMQPGLESVILACEASVALPSIHSAYAIALLTQQRVTIGLTQLDYM